MQVRSTPRGWLAGGTLVLAVWLALAEQAAALDEALGEKNNLKACERSLCALITSKKPVDGPFTCALSKTWSRERLKDGSAVGKVTWGFGDARCSVDLSLERAAIVQALTAREATLQFPEHTVTCHIERDKGPAQVTGRLAPKILFKDGEARKIWINLKQVTGPTTLKGLAYSVAKVEDSVGLFQSSLLKALNAQISEKCPKVAAGG